jgi:peptidyl-tRNA hydrolase, PTH1 family
VILIVGLGNPGGRYERTRHNAGFLVVDRFLDTIGGLSWQNKFHGLFAQVDWHGERIQVLKPATYMNLSGRSVRAATSFFKTSAESVLVVHDELDLPFGELRLKLGGGDAGHKGLASITAELGTSGYGRLRFGIGRPPPEYQGSGADFVLEAFTSEERESLNSGLDRAVEAIRLVARDGMAAAMNVTNRRYVNRSLLQDGVPGAKAQKENS